MRRTTLAAAAVAATVLAWSPAALASPSETVNATVVSSGPDGQKIKLTDHGKPAGQITFTKCGEGSSTSYFCAGTGTVNGLGPAKVRFRWYCPPTKSCVNHAEGTLKHNGATLALLHVAASVPRVQREEATFTIRVEEIPE